MRNLTLIAMALFTLAIASIVVTQYTKHRATENFLHLVESVEEERDTTSSIRNYEVLTDSLNNLYLRWLEDEEG